jgi:hypothetical protein
MKVYPWPLLTMGDDLRPQDEDWIADRVAQVSKRVPVTFTPWWEVSALAAVESRRTQVKEIAEHGNED